jgi:hypothetical protein
MPAFLPADRRDLGAHETPVNEIQVQHFDAVIVAGALEIAVQEMGREIPTSLCHEIHDQEGDVAKYIDSPQIGTELDTVEEGDAGRQAHEVTEM